jgi:hypothetical protein
MISDINFLIDFFNKNTYSTIDKEIDEQDDTAAAPASPSSGGGGSIPKWSDSYTITRGKANMLGLAGEKHSTGLTRGAANQIW